MQYVYKLISSPVGQLKLIGNDAGLAAVLWENDPPRRVRIDAPTEDAAHPVLLQAERELNEYFAGVRTAFAVKLNFVGTAFQQRVWQALMAIPFGETPTYGEIARRIGQPTAVRAVGAAIGKNSISIIGPCHRVLGSTGKLTGFAGGLPTKAFLLQLERTVSLKRAS